MVLLAGLITVPIVYPRSPRKKHGSEAYPEYCPRLSSPSLSPSTTTMLVAALFAIFAIALPRR